MTASRDTYLRQKGPGSSSEVGSAHQSVIKIDLFLNKETGVISRLRQWGQNGLPKFPQMQN